jgi:hypothetical protein
VEDRVKGPAIGLIVTGVLTILVMVLNVVMPAMVEEILKYANRPPEEIEQMRAQVRGSTMVALLELIWFGAWSGLLIYAGLQMMKLRAWTLGVVASIAAMLPCTAVCCCIGLPIGIWSLVVLFKPEVKQAFVPIQPS